MTALYTLKDLNTFDAVINLAGEPIFDKKWTVQQKEKLRHSRINLTQQIVQLINQSEHLPVLISGSATGIYGDRGEYVITEDTHPSSQFTAQLCIDWENAAKQANTRVCLVRTGLVLSPKRWCFCKNAPALSLRIRWQIREWQAILELDRIRGYGKRIDFFT